MKKWLITLLTVICFYPVIGQPPKEKTLLWQVSGKNISQPSYLYGTLHLMCPGDAAVDTVIKSRFNSTSQLFLEIKTDDPTMMAEMLRGLKMKDTTNIRALLGESDFDSANAIFQKSTGIPLQMFNRAKPILVTSFIYPSLLGCAPDSWEKIFEKMAKDRNMPLIGLETIAEQMQVIESIPYQEQAQMLLKTLYNLDSTKASYLQMLEIYKSKDIAKLYSLTTSDADFGAYENEMLVNRNNNWIGIIKREAEKKPTFFAVGAAHLGGNTGVISLLRKEGYTVKPIMY